MANHKSAKKRSAQSSLKNSRNSQYLSRFRTALNKFQTAINTNSSGDIEKSFSNINSIMAKAVKKGIFKKQYLARKLSSLSKQIKKI